MARLMISILSLLMVAGVAIGQGVPPCRWSDWINDDTPSQSGEFEALDTHKKDDLVTVGDDESTVKAECRRKNDGTPWDSIVPMDVFKVPCTAWGGLICVDHQQPGGQKCQNYEVRYLICPNSVNECALDTDNCHENAYCTKVVDGFTCTCYPGYVGDGEMCRPGDECVWSDWFDRDTPGGSGDYEELESLLRDGYWHYDKILAIDDVECRSAINQVPWDQLSPLDNFKIACSAEGLKCKGEEQDEERACHDYEVRYKVCPPDQQPCTCYCRGDPACRPFDGDWRLVPGAGTYNVLDINEPCDIEVSVTMEGKENPDNKMFITSVAVNLGGDEIELLDNGNALVETGTVFTKRSIVSLPYTGPGYTISKDDKWTVFEADCGITVRFHGKGMSSVMEITAPPGSYANGGMCGDCDGDVEGYVDAGGNTIAMEDPERYRKAANAFLIGAPAPAPPAFPDKK